MKFPLLPVFILSIFSCMPICSFSQALTVDKQAVDFGVIFTQASDSEVVIIRNNNDFDVNVSDVKLYNGAFAVNQSKFQVPAKGSYNLTVYCAPKQNIRYSTAMILLADSKHGTLSLDLDAQGRFADTYYSTTENLWEEDLKAALKRLVSGHTSLGYNGARDRMFMEIDNKKANGQGAATNTLECVYTGRQAVNYTNRADAQTNHNFNTEHTFPQGFFNENEPMKSDIHHLFPTDEMANTRRSNNPFGIVATPTWQEGGSESASGVFEPRDVHKGNAARALFYFVIRYQDYANHVKSQETILRDWINFDGVDSAELRRNNDIFKYQKNKNPFIDHPEFVERIHSFTSIYTIPDDYSLEMPVETIALNNISGNDSVLFHLPFAATGNKDVTVTNLRFSNPAYQVRKGTDVIEPGNSGYVSFVYKPTGVIPQHTDTLTATIASGKQKDIKIPILVNAISGIAKSSPEPSLKVYPNPVHEMLYIDVPENGFAEVEIYNMLGEKMLREQCQLCGVNTSTLTKGVYIVKIKEGQKVYSHRIIKQ